MLYLRRKAEIEVLSSAAKAAEGRVATGQDPDILDMDDVSAKAEVPLVRYLVAKISSAVDDHARKFAFEGGEDGRPR